MSTNVEGQIISPNDAKPRVVRSAYYTPTIDEFYVGFDCQIKYAAPPEDDWKDETICQSHRFEDLKKWLDKGEIRVKHIDKEDCISLGLELKIWDNGSGYFQKGNYTIGIYGTDLFCTVGQNDYGNNIIRFSGDLKNKSELKRILQQTGCV